MELWMEQFEEILGSYRQFSKVRPWKQQNEVVTINKYKVKRDCLREDKYISPCIYADGNSAVEKRLMVQDKKEELKEWGDRG